MRLRSTVAFGLGYLLGTRAGRDRFKELVDTGQELSETLREFTASSAVAQDVIARVRGALGLPPEVASGGRDDGGQADGGESSPQDTPRVHVVTEPEPRGDGA